MASESVLLVVRDKALRDALGAALDVAGFSTRATDEDAALTACADRSTAVVLLELDFSSGDEGELLRRLREREHAPLLLALTGGGEVHRVRALERGADDCVSLPASTREVVLRVSALRRRLDPSPAGDDVRVGRIHLDPSSHRVDVDGRPVPLTLTEFRILRQLALAEGEAISRSALRERVWGEDTSVDGRAVDTHIRRLRAKLGAAREHIETVHGAGYRLRS